MKQLAALGLDLGGTHIRCAGDGRLAGAYAISTTGIEFSMDALVDFLSDRIHTGDEPTPDVVGVALPGLIEADTLTVSDVLPSLVGLNAAELSHTLGADVFLLNDAHAAMWGLAPQLDEDEVVVLVSAGTGIACRIWDRGRILTGDSGLAGELGYFQIGYGTGRTRLDDVASGQALCLASNCDAHTLFGLAKNADPLVRERIVQAGAYCGSAIATLINLLQPSRVVIRGGLTRLPGYFEGLKREVEAGVLARIWQDGHLEVVDQDDRMAAFGACSAAKAFLDGAR